MFSDIEVKAALKMFHVIRAFDESWNRRVEVGLALWDESTLRAVRLYEAWDEAFEVFAGGWRSAFNGSQG